jgi:hypothetical protein
LIQSSELGVALDKTMLSQFSEDLSELNEGGVAHQTIPVTSDASLVPASVFTLDGMDDIFLEDADDEKH